MVEWDQEEAAVVLRMHGAQRSILLLALARKGMTGKVAAGMVAGQDVNARDTNKQTPLHLAASRGHAKVVGKQWAREGGGDGAGQGAYSCQKRVQHDGPGVRVREGPLGGDGDSQAANTRAREPARTASAAGRRRAWSATRRARLPRAKHTRRSSKCGTKDRE